MRSKQVNILIVDDQKLNIEFLNILIKKNMDNIDILTTTDSTTVIDILNKNDINIILLDINMPTLDGWEVAKKIKEDERFKNIAIIFVTDYYKADEFKQKGFKLGAVDFIAKPIDKDQFINRLNLYKRIFLQEKELLLEIEKNKEKDKQILQNEIRLAQNSILENIAHHWRQPLSVISTSASFLDIYLDGTLKNIPIEELSKYAKNIVNSTKEMSQTVDMFLNFFQPEEKRYSFNISDTIKDCTSIMHFNFLEKNINIEYELDDIKIYSYENGFKQILLSLLTNSLDILVEKNDLNNRYIKVVLTTIKDKIVLKMIDNGGGIPNDIQDKIFQPYFTTKHQYSGTGLSLHIVKELLSRCFNGTIKQINTKHRFDNKLKDCTQFEIQIDKNGDNNEL
ncbi:MAG: hybrid sensor histidine kinase/response regulator [Campylobacterota bacterium]|nr:hybrid sensor histidine kinase/response regulator [Campylobacterota bacterium]